MFIFLYEILLFVNVIKIKIVIFINGGNICNNEKWCLNSEFIEIVDSFIYFGL